MFVICDIVENINDYVKSMFVCITLLINYRNAVKK